MSGFNARAFNPSPEQAFSNQQGASPTTASQGQACTLGTSLPPQRFRGLVTQLSRTAQLLRQGLVQCFVAGDQPQVKWWRDAQGHDHYSLYDPHRQQTHDFATAHEVRVWLEQRYYE